MSTPSWISGLATASIATDMAAADVNGVVSYAGLEKVFADLAAKLTSTGTTLTQAQLADLQTISANLNNGLSTSSYLTYVTKALVNGNAANAKWTGGAASPTALGNLAVGASGAQLTKLTGKWYLGSDLPTSSVTMDGSSFSVSYSVSTRPLFASGGPSMNDINQGYLGDCYLLSGLAEVALQNSSLISSMFTVNGNGTYGVRFYVNGQAEYVTVDASLANGGNIFNYGGSDIWASLAEKAYAELQASGVVTGNSVNYGNSFSTIGNGGAPEYALEQITGATVITDFVASGGTWARVVYNSSFQVTNYTTGYATATVCAVLCADLAQGNDLVLSSYTNATDSAGKTTLVADHAMSITGFDSVTGNFVIRNPWGTESGQYWDTTFEVSLGTLLAAGDTITADNVIHFTPPSLSVNSTVSANRGQVLTLSGLLAITDQGNVGYQKLELKDTNGTAVGGRFMVNGVAQAGGVEIDVTAANLAQVVYDAGTAAGTDTLWAQLLLNDGTQTGWQQITVNAVDRAPVVTATNITAAHGQTIAATSLFSASDADHDTITAYQVWDSAADPSSGHWIVGGVAQAAGQAIDVTVAQLASTTFQSGYGSDQLWARAYDGTAWGVWQDFTVNAPVDHAAVVTASNVTATRGQTIAASNLFSASDADHDTITAYQLWDDTADPSSGHWIVGGVAQAAGHAIDVTAAQLASTTFQSGSGSDHLWARAYDGTMWGGWQDFTVNTPVDYAPVASAGDFTASHGQTIAASSLFSASDADHDTITAYQFWDSTADPTSGHWIVGGVAQAAGQAIDVTAAQLSSATFQSGSGSDHLWVRAFDGTMWGAWQDFYVKAPVDHAPVVAPVVSAVNGTVAHGASIAATALFQASDLDNDTITAYQLWDSTVDPSSGHWVVVGIAQLAGQAIDVTAAQLSSATFQSGSGSDHLWARAFDGTMWGAWQDFYVNAPVDHTPVVSAANATVSHGQAISAAGLFSVSDGDPDTITAYQLWDSTPGSSSGYWVVGGVAQAAGQAIDVTAAQLASTTFQSGSGSDRLWARAWDGIAWGAWQDFSVTAPVDLGPTLTVANLTSTAGQQSVAASSLFTYSDPFGSPATQYDFWDNGVGGGHFALNGTALGAGQDNIISASQLSQVTYQPGNGADTLWIRANDGTTWGAWSRGFSVAA